jgi:predicted nucleic acid-binding protein
VIVIDASIALKWFVDEPGSEAARAILDQIAADPSGYAVPDLFMNELLAVLARLPGVTTERVQEALSLVESLGLARVGNGHELIARAAELAVAWAVSGDDATYLALADLTGGEWVTADARAARRVRTRRLVRLITF